MASRVVAYIMQMVGQHVAKHAVEYISRVIQEGQHSEVAKNAGKAFARGSRISLAEARQILHLPENATMEEALQKYKHLYEKNGEAGATYIQGRVYRAMERLEMENGGGPITGMHNQQQQTTTPGEPGEEGSKKNDQT